MQYKAFWGIIAIGVVVLAILARWYYDLMHGPY